MRAASKASYPCTRQVGDGTNFVLVLSGALLENAEDLLRMGLSPAEVVEGYDQACEKALEVLPSTCVCVCVCVYVRVCVCVSFNPHTPPRIQLEFSRQPHRIYMYVSIKQHTISSSTGLSISSPPVPSSPLWKEKPIPSHGHSHRI